MVYVDDMNAPFGRMVMCHMVADTKEELLAMADKIGVARKWIQKEGTEYEHFDICQSKKKLAIENGAISIEYGVPLALIFKKKREQMKNKLLTQKEMAKEAKKRPQNYKDLSAEQQWKIDKELGILDWDGTE